MRLILLAMWAVAAAAQGNIPWLPPDYAARVAELERAHRANPADVRVLDALAGSYTMGGQYSKAIRVIEQALPAAPASAKADLELRLARNLTWAGQGGRAIRTYESYLKKRPRDRQATIELIRLRRYRGDYSQAEKLANRLLEANPDDAEALALKAEVLHWAGNRKHAARRAADRAARVAADFPDAKVAQVYALRDQGENRRALQELSALREQVARRGGPGAEATYRDAYRLLESEMGHPQRLSNAPVYSVYNDSDGIHNVFWGMRFEAPVRDDHRLRLDLSQHQSSAPAGIFTDGRTRSYRSEFAAGGTLRAGPAVYFTLLGGGSRRSGQGGLSPIFGFQAAASPVDRWTFDFQAEREFLKVTPRAIDRDVFSYKVAGGAQYAFDSRTSLALHADRRYWSDQNRSIAGEATLRRVVHYYKPFTVDGGALARWEKFDVDTRFRSGFFTPGQYRRHDGFAALHGELGRRMSYEVRGAGGAQRVSRTADYRPDWEATSSVTIRLNQILRLSASYQRRNYSLLSRNGWYQGFYITLGM